MSSSASSSSDDLLPKLPEDVIVEILKRLPVRCLLRFRCVCRSWRSTIDGPLFVALHLNHSALDPSNRYLACLHLAQGNPLHLASPRSLCSLSSGDSLSMSQIEVPFAAPFGRYRFVGSCNGLICLTKSSRIGLRYHLSTYLWNLFTRKHKAVSQSRVDSAVGFGFDARSNDYKIVRIYSRYVAGDSYPYTQHPVSKRRVEIYSLSTDSWRSLECEVPTLSCSRTAVFLNENLHWFVSHHNDRFVSRLKYLRRDRGYGSILLFDVTSEVFNKMALSAELLRKVCVSRVVVLSLLNDLLAVCTSSAVRLYPRQRSTCSIWVMKEYGMPESWTKLYSFLVDEKVRGFDGFTMNGELLMVIDDDERVSWNPITRQFTYPPLVMRSNLVTVVESLVSLEPRPMPLHLPVLQIDSACESVDIDM